MDAFISWTGADRDVKNAIVEKLQEAGITCWDSDENCVSDFSEECIAAIKRCGLFILIISDSSMEKGYVKNETITARNLEEEGKLNILVYKITDKPYTNSFEFLINHISFAYGNLIQRKENLSGENGIDTIVKRAKVLLQKRKEGNPEKPFEVNTPQIDGLKITKSGYFVENSRNDVLCMIDEKLEESNVIVLKELFGFGKKSTIKKFAELHKYKYDTVVMVDNEAGSLREFFITELNFNNINPLRFENLEGNALLKEKFKLLEKLDENTMIIIPSVRFEGLPDEFICQNLISLKCKFILITQESPEQYTEWFPIINLGRMSDEHLTELFFHYYPYAYEDEMEQLCTHLKEFFAGIGGHTKTVELTASVLSRELGVHPEEIPQYLTLQGTEGMQLRDRIMTQISHMFSMESLSEQELLVLLVAAYMAVPRISESRFRDVLRKCGIFDWQIVMKLDKLRWIDVDIRERSISIEPLIAKIIIDKNPENYFVIYTCLETITDNLPNAVFVNASSRAFRSFESFLRNTGFNEPARILSLISQYNSDKENFDASFMKRALDDYEKAYNFMDYDESIEEEFNPDTEEASEEPEEYFSEEKEEYTLSDCKLLIKAFMSGVNALSKIIASGLGTELIYNFSEESQSIVSSKLGQNYAFFDVEEILGFSINEIYESLALVRNEIEEGADFDSEDAEYIVVLQALAVMDAFYNRNYSEFMSLSLSMLSVLEQFPEGLVQDKDSEQIVVAVYMLLLQTYMKMKAYDTVIHLCEKALEWPTTSESKLYILNVYITALRYSYEYGEKLYSAHEKSIKLFNKLSKEAFESRESADNEKKHRIMVYAYDLAKGERIDEALEQFEAAQQLGKKLQTKDTIDVAEEIVDVFMKLGEFESAVEFINKYFPDEYIDFLRHKLSAEDNAILDNFESYKSFSGYDKSEHPKDNETEYIDYYRDYSRKNNSLQESRYRAVAEKAMHFDFSSLTDEQIKEQALSLKQKAKKEKLLSLAPEVFALASEAGFRVLGYKHHYVQYMGAAAMAEGNIAEILNGEGKTYTIVLVAFLNFIYGRKAFVVDSSPYLIKRNFDWMHGVYNLLGMHCEHIDHSKQILNQADVTYISVKNLIMGFLGDETHLRFLDGHIEYGCAIIDEADSVLVDEALQRYALVSTDIKQGIVNLCEIAYELAKEVAFDENYYLYQSGDITLKQSIRSHIEQYFNVSYEAMNDIKKIDEIEKILRFALLCCNHAEKGVYYYIEKGRPVYENTAKGVFESFDALREFFLAKINNLDTTLAEKALSHKSITLNSICLKDMFKRFDCVCGTTATAVSFKKEFKEIYHLDYVAIPPFAPCIRKDTQSPIYIDEAAKIEAIINTVKEKHEKGQPILLITQSVEESEKYSMLLDAEEIPHKLLNAKNSDDSSDMLVFAGEPYSVLVATFLVNRGCDIKLGGNPEFQTRRALVNMGVDVTGLEKLIYAVPSKEQKESPLYKRYHSLLVKNKLLTAEEKQIVIDEGGLCVIGTSFFSEPRTEQQTRGRSGRQGEVGESIVFRSLDDAVLKRLFPQAIIERLKAMCPEGVEIDAKMLNKQLQLMQQKIHDNNFSKIRKTNNCAKYIDDGRKVFTQTIFELNNGTVTVDDIIRKWAADETVNSEFKLLQKGLKAPGNTPLQRLFTEHKEKFLSAKFQRTQTLLFNAFKETFAKNHPEADDKKTIGTITILLSRGWVDYIQNVDKTLENVEMSERALNEFFEKERNRIFTESIEKLLYIIIR